MILSRTPMLVERQPDGTARCTPLRVVAIDDRSGRIVHAVLDLRTMRASRVQ